MKRHILFGILFFLLSGLAAQPPAGNPLRWQKSYGGSMSDLAYAVIQTNDGGYIAAGSTQSNDFDVTNNFGNEDFWVVKMDNMGNIQWQMSYGGPGTDIASCIIQTSDLGYLVAGKTNSISGQITQSYGNNDYWVIKLSASGSVQWQHSYGGSDIDEINDAIQTSDGGYILAGRSYSPDGNITDHNGMFDAWIVKINTLGTIEWSRSYGGSLTDEAKSIIQTTDLGYLVACSSNSNDSDVTANHGGDDYWIIKLNSVGAIQWQKSFGGSSADIPSKIIKTFDNNFLVQGSSSSNDGDVTGNHLSQDYWAVKINLGGGLLWQKSLGGSNIEIGTSVVQAADSSFVLCGHTQSNDGDVLMNHGMWDTWVVKLANNGSLIWAKPLGGSNYDFANSISQGNTGSTVIAGNSNSSDGNLTSNHGMEDFWIADVKGLTASFTPSNDTICAKQNVNFINNTINATNFIWKINNVVFGSQVSFNHTFNTPGIFNVTLIASNAVSIDSLTVPVLVKPLPAVSLGNDTTICSGNSVILDPGYNIDYSYYWSTGMTTPTITVLTAGNFSVTVTDNISGCVNVDTITVYIGAPVVVDLGSDRMDCIGNTVTLNAGPSTGVSFLWSTGATTQIINVTTTDDYSVTVTKISTGCSDRDTVHVTFNPTPGVNLGPDQNVCNGTYVSLDAGFFPGASYYWSTSENTQIIHPTSTGYFYVTVVNSYGCIGKDTIHVTINPTPNVNLGSDYSICSNTSTTLDAGYFSGASYSWSTGATSQAISVSTGNTYSVTVTNLFGCSDADTITIIVVNSPVVDLGDDQTACIGDTILLDAQNAGGTYVWSTGLYTQTISVYASGQYSVTVTNLTSGCQDVDTISIGFITAPNAYLGADQSICAGDTAWLSAPYIIGATYLWSGGSSGQSYPATITGTYSVTVSLSTGCSDADTVNVNVNTPPVINLGQDITSCTGDTVTIGASSAGCTYYWQPGAQTTPYIDVFVSNTYILKVTDINGCTDADTINVLFNPSPAIVVDSIKYASCYGLSDGAVFTTIDFGTPPFNYIWSDLAPVNDDHLNLAAGSYSLTVTDANGCTDSSLFNIYQPSELTIDSVEVVNASCPNSTDGSINVMASGGTGSLNYSIDGNNFQPSAVFQNLSQGTYSVTVKDANGCIATWNNIDIISNSNLTVFLGNDTIVCYGSSITLDAGNPGGTYYWTPSGITSQTNTVTAGTYSVMVSLGGCYVSDTIVIDEYSSISVSVDSVVDVGCFGGNNGIIFTTVMGDMPPFTYSWAPNNGTSVGSNYMNLTAGTYNVTVTDSIGCTASQSAVVSEPAALTIITDSVNDISCYGLTNAAIYLSPGGGTSPYTFIWSTGQNTDDIENIPAGTYSVTCTDASGCTASETYTITNPTQLSVVIDSIINAIVCGSATGAMYITPGGGVIPYLYAWSDGTVNEDDIDIYPGTYSVTVTDHNGCSSSVTEIVDDNYCQTYVIPGTTLTSVCDSTTYTELSPMVIIEYADTSAGFIKSQNNVHLILKAPDNFEFEAGTGHVEYVDGTNNITNAIINVGAQYIDITFSTSNIYNHLDTLAFVGIKVKAQSNAQTSPNEIKVDPSSTAIINGISAGTVLGIINQSTLMSVTNINTFHLDSTDVVRGSLYNCVAGIKITTSGNCGTPLAVQEFELTTAASDNPYDNIIEARIFYTGHSPYFGAVDIQGTSILPDGNFSIVAATPQDLLEGDNYFWLTYDIKDSAIVGDSLEGQCIKCIIDGNYYYATVIPPQPLKRMVNSPGSFISHHSGNWDEAWTWGNPKGKDKTAWSPDVNDDVTINGGDVVTLTSNSSCRHLTINDGQLILGSYQLTISGNLTGAEKDNITSTSSSSLVINDFGGVDQFPIPSSMTKLKKITLNRSTGAYSNHDLDMDDAVPSDSIVLVLSNGAFEFSSGKKLFLNSKAIQKNILCSNSTYVDGIVSRNIKRNSGFYIFPLGDNGESRRFGIATQAGSGSNISEIQFFWGEPINYAYVNYSALPGGITDKYYWHHVIVSGQNTQRRIYYDNSDFPLDSLSRATSLMLANNSAASSTTEWNISTDPYTIYDNTGQKYVQFNSAGLLPMYGSNVITNSDFSSGNTGFTSGYTYVAEDPADDDELWPEGYYSVGTCARDFHPHWSVSTKGHGGSGNFLIVNGNTVNNIVIWQEVVTVTANTTYDFSAWLCSIHPLNPADLQFSINGSTIGTHLTATTDTVNHWEEFYTTWYSGSSTSATISIVNKNTIANGNDFGLDDITFTPCVGNNEYWTFGSVSEDFQLAEEGLPIELLRFDAALNEQLSVDLEWTTASETNNDYFTVERAGPDMQFYPLFNVNGAGNNFSLLAYHTVDDDPLEGISYYRLKQTDFNGDYTYSDIRMIVWDADNPVIVYPNPTRDVFNIQFFSQQSDNVTISLYDDKGLKVYENEFSIQKGTNEVTVDMQKMSHAVYMLRIDFENNTIKPFRMKVSKI